MYVGTRTVNVGTRLSYHLLGSPSVDILWSCSKILIVTFITDVYLS